MAGTSGISTVCLVHFSWSHATNTPDRPNRPNEKDRLADFSILLEKSTRKAGLLPARLVQAVLRYLRQELQDCFIPPHRANSWSMDYSR